MVEKGDDDSATPALPMQMSEIKRGDFLVHRDHGVGVCLGLVLKGEGADVQEFLAIKYGDGAILSIDVGRLDLVGFFAPSDAENVILDSLSKKGVWNRKKSSAKSLIKQGLDQGAKSVNWININLEDKKTSQVVERYLDKTSPFFLPVAKRKIDSAE